MKLLSALVCYLFIVSTTSGQPVKYFKIRVVDDKTGRGVPLVELKTTNNLSYYTDNNGIIAFYEPGLMQQEVYFFIKSHGYEYPKDGFGYSGKALRPVSGDSALIKIRRINIAERLYRVTGEGLYNHSILVGEAVPLKQPLLNGKVIGQDTFIETLYKGKIYWFWGDTGKPSYPLGNFATSGATSEVPARGGLDPAIGVDLNYFVDESGFSKKMCPIAGPGPVWIHWLATLKDSLGADQLVTSYTRVKNLGEAYEHGLAVFDDAEEVFKPVKQFDLKAPLFPDGQSFRVRIKGEEYIYFDRPLRVRADWNDVKNLSTYQGFTCLTEGSRFDSAYVKIDRTKEGRPNFKWKTNTEPLSYDQEQYLIKKGWLKPEETALNLCDFLTGDPLIFKSGSVFWNEYLKKWVMIFEQLHGTSYMGEVWFAQADTPTGPWVYARKIVTHDKYTFYNVGQHPLFDQENGRLIYFEGTYTESFSGNPVPTPRYDYNQIMYRLDLSDARLYLPSPVYKFGERSNKFRYRMHQGVNSLNSGDSLLEVPFFAMSPERNLEGTIPVFEVREKGKTRLRAGNAGKNNKPLFFGLPGKDFSSVLPERIAGIREYKGDGSKLVLELKPAGNLLEVPLFEFRDHSGNYSYSTKTELEGMIRTENAICNVWENRSSILSFDFDAIPVSVIK